MSGIDEMKKKIKKKLTLDDMSLPEEPITQRATTNTESEHLAIQSDVRSDLQENSITAVQQNAQTVKQDSLVSAQQNSALSSSNSDVRQGLQKYSSSDVQQYENTATHQNDSSEVHQPSNPLRPLHAKPLIHQHSETSTPQNVQVPTLASTQQRNEYSIDLSTITEIQKVHQNGQEHGSSDVHHNTNTSTHLNSNRAIPQHQNIPGHEYDSIQRSSNIGEGTYSKTSEQKNSNTLNPQYINTATHYSDSFQPHHPNTGGYQNQQAPTPQYINTAQHYISEPSETPHTQLQNQHFTNQILVKKKTPKYPVKMTVYVTEELHKKFNDIYARRMLEGRPTEKSELMCEAVRLLIAREGG